MQEGTWPDLRLRGSLLGSERLVDVLAGRAAAGAAAVVGQTSALLDEERRLFYVATTRAKHRLIVTAVASAGIGPCGNHSTSGHRGGPRPWLPDISPSRA